MSKIKKIYQKLLLLFISLLISLTKERILDLDTLYLENGLYSTAYNETMEWGTYKPNLFFGLKNRNSNPINIGLVWFVPESSSYNFGVRHTYKYESGEGVTAYFDFHDGWSSCNQVIKDPKSNTEFNIKFVKQVFQQGSNNEQYDLEDEESIEQTWQAVITISQIDEEKPIRSIPYIYIQKQNFENELDKFKVNQLSNKDQNENENGSAQQGTRFVRIQNSVSSKRHQIFELGYVNNENTFDLIGVESKDIPIWNVHEFFDRYKKNLLMSQGGVESNSNFIIARLGQINQPDQQFMISFKKKSFNSLKEANKESVLNATSYKDVLSNFEFAYQLKKRSFDNRFDYFFNLNQKRFEQDEVLKNFKLDGLQFSKEVLSNLLGGIGYYYGPVQIKDRNQNGKINYESPAPLFTGCPSRNRFPRGFLWDEGFHLLLTCQWQRMICFDIYSHWFNTMQENGWIPREQIRGKEAESVVPSQFIPQDPKVANPPSMIFAMTYLVKQAQKGNQDKQLYSFLESLFSKWQTWYSWFYESQENPSMPFTFSWQGRTAEENLPSGLDDYPRAYLIHQREEIHLDLQSWMIAFSDFMSLYSNVLNHQSLAKSYSSMKQKIWDELEEKLYNENMQIYADFAGFQWEPAFNSNQQLSEAMEWRKDGRCGPGFQNSLKLPAKCNQPMSGNIERDYSRCCSTSHNHCFYDKNCDCPQCEYHVSIDYDWSKAFTNSYTVHTGIVNFFPLAFGLVKDEERIESMLRKLGDTQGMLSTMTGIRSLSKRDQFFLHESNYWRGAVWINVNFIVLRGLFNNYLQVKLDKTSDFQFNSGKELYQQIRKSLIESVYKNWRVDHMFWEQYDQSSGKGLYTNPFTGWTTLIFLIISENYG